MIHETAQIHPTSVVEEGAIIGANVKIGPFCFVDSKVEIGEGTELLSHVVVKGQLKSVASTGFSSLLQLVKRVRT